MPESLPGLVVVVALALPGLAFFFVRSQYRVAPERTALIETAVLVVVGFVADVVGFSALAIAHVVAPTVGPDLRLLVLDGAVYLREHFWTVVVGWIVAIFIASLVAVLIALLGARQGWERNRLLRLLRGPIVRDSSWELVFNAESLAEVFKWCVCVLTGGQTVAGILASSSPDPRETSERDLVLASPIYHDDGNGGWAPSSSSRLVVSAGQIVTLEVHYYSETPDFGGPSSAQVDRESGS